MATVTDKIAYARGLKDGLNLQDVGISKLFDAVLDALDAAAVDLNNHETDINELDECLNEVFTELDTLEEDVVALEEVVDDWDDMICECCEDDDEYDDDSDDDWDDIPDDFEPDGNVIALVCPDCGEDIALDLDVFRTGMEIDCPNCDRVLFSNDN